jgi:hypothetical protein
MINPIKDKLLLELSHKNWYKKTSKEVKVQLAELPEDCNGFLVDLVARSEESGNVRLIKLLKLLVGNFILTPVFEVESIQTKQKFTFEYASWKHGSMPGGFRGILFLEDEGKIKYFIVRRSDRFSLSKTIYDAVASFYSSDAEVKGLSFTGKIEKQLGRILGNEKLNIRRIIDLGQIYPDTGMSNVAVSLFAGIIDITGHAEEVIRHLKNKKFDPYIVRWDMDIFPIDDLVGFVEKTDDSFLMSTISRVIARKIVPGL